GRTVTLVGASNRTDKSLALYLLDTSTLKLARAAPPVPTGLDDPYGMCLYRSAKSGSYFVFINNSDDGLFRQWRIFDDNGRMAAEPVRDFLVGTQSEGCVADDETGALYIAEEDGGFWKYSAEPDGGDTRTEIDRIDGPNGLVGDIEGVAIWHGRDGKGYLVVSNQGADNYAVYRREGNHEFVGMFHIVADPDRGVDGVAETDGLEITSRPLGPKYPDGLLVVQDGRNLTPPAERQNYKYVSWRAIAEALGLSD
ncbi:MAG: phytase, partial [Pseudomonadota bacterium]|nr:phytase [Pseudomonadota bacterium]